MTAAAAVPEALASVRTMLAADGYELDVHEDRGGLVAKIKAGPTACAECLVPKDIMRTYFESALRASVGIDHPDVRLVYPGDLET
jgi:hypothetical protein